MTRVPIWSRIEPDTRSTDPRRGAAVVTADPLWLLGRQWWVGELQGYDGGAPIRAEVDVTVEPVRQVATGEGGRRRPWDTSRHPLASVLAESGEVDPAPGRRALDRGRLLLALLRDAVARGELSEDDGRRLRRDLTVRFPGPFDSPAARRRSATSAFGDELLDGSALLAALGSGEDPLADHPALRDRWLDLIGGDPTEGDEQPGGSFDPDRRAHDVTLVGEHGSIGRIADADGPSLGWEDVDIARGSVSPTTVSVVPSRSVFEGQPPPRWWTRSSAASDWVSAPAGPTDLPRLVVTAAFVEQGADWWLLPLEVETDAFVSVTDVRLIDAFGEAVPAGPAEVPSLRLWEAGAGPATALCLAGASNLAGDAIEEVELRPDDLRNMVWAIERIVADGDGRGVRLVTGAEAREVTEERIVIRTPAPTGWIPYRPDPGQNALVQVPLTSAEGLRRPRGVLAPDRLEFTRAHLPTSGVAVKRTPRLARSRGGDRTTWVVRTASDAQTTGGPGLRHDVVEKPGA